MPFIRAARAKQEKLSSEAKNTKQAIPIFLIPGVTGNSAELQNLADKLSLKYPNNPVYIYHNERLLPEDLRTKYGKSPITIDELAKDIVKYIKRLLPAGLPLHIAGHSLGAVLAVKAGQIAKDELDIEVIASVIDGPAPSESQRFLVPNNKKATTDLKRIMSFTGTQTGLRETEIDLKDGDPIFEQEINDQLKQMATRLFSLNFDLVPEKMSSFSVSTGIVRTNIDGLLSCSVDYIPTVTSAKKSPQLDEIQVLSTEETRTKFDLPPDLGWKAYAKFLSTEPVEGTHTSIIDYKATVVPELVGACFADQNAKLDEIRNHFIASSPKTIRATTTRLALLKVPQSPADSLASSPGSESSLSLCASQEGPSLDSSPFDSQDTSPAVSPKHHTVTKTTASGIELKVSLSDKPKEPLTEAFLPRGGVNTRFWDSPKEQTKTVEYISFTSPRIAS
jgi:thioesterase domain-containing protein